MAGARPITEATPRFCAQCGTRLPASARFCPSCGEGIGAPAPASAPARSLRDQIPGLVVLAFFLSAGLALWIGVLQRGTPTPTAPRGPGAAAGAPGPAAPGANVPASHPPMQLPDEAKKFVDSLVARAEAAPNDPAAWRTLAQVQARASEIDSSYGPKAIASFQRVLTIAPGDPDAIRGMGNLYYDQQQYDRAAEQYEKYLTAKPDDPSVRTDLATTYLYVGQVDRAIEAYKTVIGAHPEFLQAHFNLGLAYEAKGDRKQAMASLAKARSLAEDEPTRTRIDKVTAQLESGTASVPGGAGANAAAGNAAAPGSTGTVAQNVPSGTSAGGAHGLPAPRGGTDGAAGGGAMGGPGGDVPDQWHPAARHRPRQATPSNMPSRTRSAPIRSSVRRSPRSTGADRRPRASR